MALIPQAVKANQAERLQIKRIANEVIDLYDPIAIFNNTECITADVDTEARAAVIGIALNSAAIGEQVNILIYGVIEDPVFTFPSGGLFQSSLGPISVNSTSIVGEWFCTIGKTSGPGSIIVSPEPPIEVT